MAKSGSERVKEYRKRQRLRGLSALNIYLEPDTRKKLESIAEKTGSYDAAIRKLIERSNLAA